MQIWYFSNGLLDLIRLQSVEKSGLLISVVIFNYGEFVVVDGDVAHTEHVFRLAGPLVKLDLIWFSLQLLWKSSIGLSSIIFSWTLIDIFNFKFLLFIVFSTAEKNSTRRNWFFKRFAIMKIDIGAVGYGRPDNRSSTFELNLRSTFNFCSSFFLVDYDAASCYVLIFVEFDGSEEVFLFGEEDVQMKFGLTIEVHRFWMLWAIREISFSGVKWSGLKDSSAVNVRVSGFYCWMRISSKDRCCSLMEEMKLQSSEEEGKVGTGSTLSSVSLDLILIAT